MATDLITIASSGARAARIALDVAAQNIANAGSEGYVRRTARLAEMAGSGRLGEVTLSGVRFDGIVRGADLFRAAEVRRTGSDLARATAELSGLKDIESALNSSGVYPAIVGFEAALERLSADPVDPALRASALEDARTMARSFNLAATGLDATGDGLRAAATDGVAQFNLRAAELATLNRQILRTGASGGDLSPLLDRRDMLLEQLSGYADLGVTLKPDQTAEVRLGGITGSLLVTGTSTATLAMASASDGTASFALGGTALTLAGGSLAGQAQALTALADNRGRLDGLAAALVGAANGAQAGGVARDGSPGQPLFSGTSAAELAVALTDGSQLATAPAGAAAGSRDPANLDALRAALSGAGIADGADALLFSISSAVAGRTVTREALGTISDTARAAFDEQAGVDLDAEAVDLVRYQQAFQASGRAMQVAATLFDTILAIR